MLVQKSQIYTWDGKMPLRWSKLENFKLELPRDTLLSVEIVKELKGEVGELHGRPRIPPLSRAPSQT